MSTSSSPDGVDPSVTAVVVTRRDPSGLADLLDAVLSQTLAPDAVLVLDRTAGATTLPAGAEAPEGEATKRGPASDQALGHAGPDSRVVRARRTRPRRADRRRPRRPGQP